MTKLEAADALKSMGVKCDVRHGILWLYGVKNRKQAQGILRQIGYDATYGIRQEEIEANNVQG